MADKTFRCPLCKETVTQHPALSRLDNQTEICSNCDTDEAMADYSGGVQSIQKLWAEHG